MKRQKISIPSVGNDDFNWDMYEDGWNGYSLKVNKNVKTNNGLKVYSRESYAQEMADFFNGVKVEGSKELKRNALVSITDFERTNGDTILASINGGINNITIDLNKEQRWLNMIMGGKELTKDQFIKGLKDPEWKKSLLDLNFKAKVGTDIGKASLWDGWVENLSNEMKEQINHSTVSYSAKVISCNNGGFGVEVMGTIKAFMPGSMAAANRLTDYESLIGTTMEVCVESYDPRIGFVVSRKKYLKAIAPTKMAELKEQLKDNKDMVLTGTITGTTPFGIFVELTEVLTGMLHKTLISDSLRDALRNRTIEANTKIDVYVHKIENGRIILSDVPSSERDAVIAKREAEDAQEKTEHVSQKNTNAEPKPVMPPVAVSAAAGTPIEAAAE